MAERILVMRCKDCGTRVGEPHRDVPHTGGLYYPNLENHPAVMKPEPADPEPADPGPRAYCDDVEGEPDLRDEFAKRWDAEMAPVKRLCIFTFKEEIMGEQFAFYQWVTWPSHAWRTWGLEECHSAYLCSSCLKDWYELQIKG